MKARYYIYKITNESNGVRYVGRRTYHRTKKPEDDGYMGSGNNIKAAIALEGVERFTKEILERDLPEEEFRAREAFHIRNESAHVSLGGYNRLWGEWGECLADAKRSGEEQIAKYRQKCIDEGLPEPPYTTTEGRWNEEGLEFRRKRKIIYFENHREEAKARYEKNKEKIGAKNKARREENIEEARERGSVYRKKNKVRINENARAAYEKNKEKISTKRKVRREKNREEIGAKRRAAYEKNKEKINAKRRAKKLINQI